MSSDPSNASDFITKEIQESADNEGNISHAEINRIVFKYMDTKENERNNSKTVKLSPFDNAAFTLALLSTPVLDINNWQVKAADLIENFHAIHLYAMSKKIHLIHKDYSVPKVEKLEERMEREFKESTLNKDTSDNSTVETGDETTEEKNKNVEKSVAEINCDE